MKKAIELTEQADTKGIQVQIAGRIDGKEIACVEWIREGRVPLQTIRAKIDHCSYTVRTIYGVLGIKIWIFVDEEEWPLTCLAILSSDGTKNDKLFHSFSVQSKMSNSNSIGLNENSIDHLVELLCLVCDSLIFLGLGFKKKKALPIV